MGFQFAYIVPRFLENLNALTAAKPTNLVAMQFSQVGGYNFDDLVLILLKINCRRTTQEKGHVDHEGIAMKSGSSKSRGRGFAVGRDIIEESSRKVRLATPAGGKVHRNIPHFINDLWSHQSRPGHS